MILCHSECLCGDLFDTLGDAAWYVLAALCCIVVFLATRKSADPVFLMPIGTIEGPKR